MSGLCLSLCLYANKGPFCGGALVSKCQLKAASGSVTPSWGAHDTSPSTEVLVLGVTVGTDSRSMHT